jgi:hypothetical protein
MTEKKISNYGKQPESADDIIPSKDKEGKTSYILMPAKKKTTSKKK